MRLVAGLFILKHMHDLSDWRQRLGEEQLVALIQESLSGGAQDRGAGHP